MSSWLQSKENLIEVKQEFKELMSYWKHLSAAPHKRSYLGEYIVLSVFLTLYIKNRGATVGKGIMLIHIWDFITFNHLKATKKKVLLLSLFTEKILLKQKEK